MKTLSKKQLIDINGGDGSHCDGYSAGKALRGWISSTWSAFKAALSEPHAAAQYIDNHR